MKNTLRKHSFPICWCLFWCSIMGFNMLVFKEALGFTYESHPTLFSGFYLLSAYLASLIFLPGELVLTKKKRSNFSKILILFLILLSIYNYFFPLNITSIQAIKKKEILFPLFSFQVLLSKLSEIFFQQFLINIFMIRILKIKNEKEAIMSFSFWFFVLHLPLFYFFKLRALYFILPTIFGGVTFAFLIVSKKNGKVLSLLCHILFYVCLGLIIRSLKGSF